MEVQLRCVVSACRIVFLSYLFPIMLFSCVSFCHCAMLWHHHFLPLFHQVILPTGLSLWALTFSAFLEKFCQSLACCHLCKIWSCLSCHYYVLLLHTLCHSNFIFFAMNALEGLITVEKSETGFWKRKYSRHKMLPTIYWMHLSSIRCHVIEFIVVYFILFG